MATGFKKNGVDLDDLFEPRTTTAIANTGYKIAGVDLAQRYEKVASGSAIAATGFKLNGADLNTLFAGKGTVNLGPVDGVEYYSLSAPTYYVESGDDGEGGDWVTSYYENALVSLSYGFPSSGKYYIEGAGKSSVDYGNGGYISYSSIYRLDVAMFPNNTWHYNNSTIPYSYWQVDLTTTSYTVLYYGGIRIYSALYATETTISVGGAAYTKGALMQQVGDIYYYQIKRS